MHIYKEENGYNYQTVKQKERERIFFLRHTDNWNRVFCHMLHRFFGQLPPFALTWGQETQCESFQEAAADIFSAGSLKPK